MDASQNRNNKIQIIIITGFLGSGKTTLINNMLKFYKDKKFGMIIDDFGKIPVDDKIIKNNNKNIFDSKESKIIKIANGSIFCSCLESVFIDGLKYYLNDKPEILIIETSGISDPSSMKKIIKNNNLEASFEIFTSLCLLDASSFLKMIDIFNFIEKQIISSNYIIINKIDLIENNVMEEIRKRVSILNNQAIIITSTYSNIDFTSLIKLNSEKIKEETESCNTPFNRPASYNFEKDKLDLKEIKKALDKVEDKIIRIKGFFTDNNSVYLINGVNKKITINEVTYKPETLGITIISEKEKMKDIINIFSKL